MEAKYGFLTNHINGIHYSISELFKSEVKITKTVHCQRDSKWMFTLFGKIIQPKPECLADLPECINDETSETIFSRVSKTKFCVGNSEFPSLVKKKIEKAAPEHFQSSAKFLLFFKLAPCRHGIIYMSSDTLNVQYCSWKKTDAVCV